MADAIERKLAARNPRTGQTDYTFLPASGEDIRAASARLRGGQRAWAGLDLAERCGRLLRLAEAVSYRREAIARALAIDTGRQRVSGLEIDGVIASIRGWAAQAPGLMPEGWTPGRSNPAIRHAPQFVPYALVGVISPWNFPLTLSMIDTVPALLAGCSVLIKPSEVTPRFVVAVEEAIAAAGLSDVLGFVLGDGAAGAGLIAAADAICFTGSVATGRKVAAAAAERMIPAFLELGGKDPLIVLASSDLELATDAALRGSVLSTGQACQSIERIYVQRAVHDALLKRLIDKASEVRLNWPDISSGDIGPIIFERQAAILSRQIADAVARGAHVHTGGAIEIHGGGLWLRPTVLSGVDHSMQVMTEETFGPILPVMAFDTQADAVRLANESVYGLSAAVFAGTLEEAERVGRALEAGAVSLNDAALTGLFHEAEKQSFKLSGMGGSRMGPAGFQRFLRRKALIANTGRPAPLSAFAEDAE